MLKIVCLLVRRILGLALLVVRKDLAKDAELLALRHENAVLRRHAAGCGTNRPAGCGSPRWHGCSPAGAGAKSSPLRPRRCWPGTAFYAKTFGTELTMLSRYSDMPAAGPGELPAEERNLVLHAALPIIGGHVLMATDILGSMGQETRIGNNTTLCLDVDSKDEADRLYGALSEGGSEGSPMTDMPWGAYWGVVLDRYGIRWMVNHAAAS
jgi:PhnB protein